MAQTFIHFEQGRQFLKMLATTFTGNTRHGFKFMSKLMFLVHALILMASFYAGVNAQQYVPKNYWTFNSSPFNKDSVNSFNIDFTSYNCQYTLNSNALVGKSVTIGSTGDNINAGNFVPDSSFTIEFLFKPGALFNNTTIFRRLDGAIGAYMSTSGITFSTATTGGNDDLTVTLDGINKKQYGYYIDGNWHHMVFKYNRTTGVKSIYVDGECPSGFSKTVSAGKIVTGSNNMLFFNQGVSYCKFYGEYDEIAIYNYDIPARLIYKHYVEAQQKKTYSFTDNYGGTIPSASAVSGPLDMNEFAPGHPNVSLSATEQLKSFPLARYKPGNTLRRNFPWVDMMYFGGRFQPGVSDATSITNAVNLNEELAKNWNYYIYGQWSMDNWGIAFTNLANQNPTLPFSLITFRGQLSGAAIKSQSLSSAHYLQKSNGTFIDPNGNSSSTKYWRPSAPVASYEGDGNSARAVIQDVLSHLTRPINIINENGEVFPWLTDAALSQDPQVTSGASALGLDLQTYMARKFKENETQAYRDKFMSLPQLSNTIYTEYALDGFAQYRQKYSEARLVNHQINGQYYSTPDFYPRWANNWRNWNGPWHGWQWIVDTRVNELALGDKLFSPFVAAGWEKDETINMRPAQWLGLLKCLNMMGAEFFYTGFFNEGSFGGSNPPPANPANYAWQTVMPSYAQATTSRMEDLLRNGQVMTGDVPNYITNPTNPGYSFASGDLRKLVVVRKHSTQAKYAISGTIQPNSSMIGNAETEGVATSTIDGQQLKFQVRRQGSAYIYDKTNASSPVFYQVDGWHEKTHPSYWTKDFNVEAELYDNTSASYTLKTYVPAGTPSGDFTNYTTAISYANGTTTFTPIEYNFQPRLNSSSTYYLWVRMRSRTGASTGISVSVDNGASKTINCITDTAWNWYRYDACSQALISYSGVSQANHIIRFTPSNDKLELDKFILTSNAAMLLNAAGPNCTSGATATISSNGATTFCQGGNVVLTASSGISYLWSNGATTQSITVSQSGNYSVTVSQTGGCSGTSQPTAVIVNAAPSNSVSVSGPTSFCQGGSVTLTASGSVSYQWSNGATTQAITVNATGSYIVTVSNGSNCNATSAPVNVTVTNGTAPTISASGPVTFCSGSSVTLTASNGNSYLWSNGATTQSINVSQSGSYSVTVNSGSGCTGTSNATVVTVNSLPTSTITAGGATTFCQGGSVALTASSGSSYLWTPGNQTTQSINVGSAGSYTVRVTNSNGCSAISSPKVVSVNSLPTATISASGSTNICQGSSVSLTASSGSSYLWTPGNQTTQSINVSSAGSYTVRVTNSNGCTAISSATNVTVTNNSTPVITASGATTFCQGGNITLTASSGSAYNWSNGASTQSITVSSSGSYSVTVSNGSCTGTSATTVVTVNTPVVPTISASGSVNLIQGQTVTLTASVGSAYSWSNGATTQSITVSTAGSYTVQVTGSNGCSATSAAMQVTVTPASQQATITTSTGNSGFCAGQSVILTASSGTNYMWLPTLQTTQSITVSTVGTYSVTVLNSNGTTSTASITIVQNPSPSVPVLSYTYAPTTYQVTAYEGSAQSYSWSTGSTAATIGIGVTGNYSVRAKNSYGCFSSPNAFAINSVNVQSCIKPDMLTAYNIMSTKATVAWNPAVYADSFKVTYFKTGSTNYFIKYVRNASSLQIVELLPSTQYSFHVTSICGTITNQSATAIFTTLAGSTSCGYALLNTYTTQVNNVSAQLNWYGTDATQIKVRYRVVGSLTYIYRTLNNAGTVAWGYKLTGLTSSTTYEWSVQTICNSLTSQYTQSLYFTTLANCTDPGTPYSTDVTTSTAMIRWNGTGAADTIRVRYSPIGSSNYLKVNLAGNPGQKKLVSLQPNTQYQAWVRTKCVDGSNSDWSVPVVFTTAPLRLAQGTSDPLQLNAFPNPADNRISYSFASEEDADYTLRVCDMSGRELTQEMRTAVAGGTTDDIDLTNYTTGMYLLIIKKGPLESHLRFNVRK